MPTRINADAPRVEFQYLDYRIFGVPGYYRFESVRAGWVTAKHWKTIRGVKAAIDREYARR